MPPPHDAAYLVLRVALALAWVTAAVVFGRYLLGLRRSPWRGFGLAWLPVVAVAVGLSAWDGVDQVLLRPEEPIPGGNWLWIVFDGLAPLFLLGLTRALRERDEAYRRIEALAALDPLTGLPNRRGFEERAAIVLAGARRQGQPAAFLALDLDRFKAINDAYGHAAGDAVLAETARVMRETLRAGDVPLRSGGEEMGALLIGADRAGALALAERLRAAIEAGVPHPGGGRVTASLGVAMLGEGEGAAMLAAAQAAADAALYRAKAGGRNRVEVG